MTGSITTATKNEQNEQPASISEPSSKVEGAKAKGKQIQILVIQDNGSLAVESRKTGISTSIKRLAVRFALLFSSKDRSHWSKTFRLDQDRRAMNAVKLFSGGLLVNNTADTGRPGKIKSYEPVSAEDLPGIIEKYNKNYAIQFDKNELGDVLEKMGIAKDSGDGKGSGALYIAKLIVRFVDPSPNEQLLSKEGVTRKLSEFGALLQSDRITDLNMAKARIIIKTLDYIEDPQIEELEPVLKEISSFCSIAPINAKSEEFCTFLMKGVFEGQYSDVSKQEIKEVTTGLLKIFKGDDLGDKEKQFRENNIEGKEDADLVWRTVLINACNAVLGTKPDTESVIT